MIFKFTSIKINFFIFLSKAFFANFSATILEIDILFVLGPLLISFSIEEADNNVLLFTSSII